MALGRVEVRALVQHAPQQPHAGRLLDKVERHVLGLRQLVQAAPAVAREVGRAPPDVDVREVELALPVVGGKSGQKLAVPRVP